MKLAIEHLTEPCPGEKVNGDAVLVREEHGETLIAIIDALGHGSGAAEVASAAIDHLQSTRLNRDLLSLVDDLHHALKGSRGAAAMICRLHGGKLEGCGVGNVDLRLYPSSVP